MHKIFVSVTISWFCVIDFQAYGVSEEYYHREPYREGLGEEVDYTDTHHTDSPYR